MKLKGKATITLRNAKTGKIEFRESHENTITPALERILLSNLAGTMDYTKLLPLYSKLLGGVCLFDGTVDPTDIFLPSQEDATLTAHAGQTAYDNASDDTARGNPNAGMTGKISNGYKMTWDWLATQGNGIITDVCLTHTDTGCYWRENKSNNTMAADFTPVEKVSNGSISPSIFKYDASGDFPIVTNSEKIPLAFLTDTNHIVSISQKTGYVVQIHLAKFTGKGIWIWNDVGDVEDEVVYEVTQPYQRCFVVVDKENYLLYLLGTQDLNSPYFSSHLRGKVIDLSTGTESSFDADADAFITAHKSEFLQCNGNGWEWMYTDPSFAMGFAPSYNRNFFTLLPMIEGSIIVPIGWVKSGLISGTGMTDGSIRVNLSDPTEFEVVKGFIDYQTSGFNDATNQGQIDLGNGRIMNNEYMAWKDNLGDYKAQEILRDNTDLFPSDYKIVREYTADQPVKNPVQYMTYVSENTGSNMRGVILNKLYAATVFHLENPITKTASQTMQVEYSIYQQEGES